LTKTLEARGISYEKFRQSIKDRFIVAQLRMKNISSEIIISPHKIESYYVAHREEFKEEDRVKLRKIILKNRPMQDAKKLAKKSRLPAQGRSEFHPIGLYLLARRDKESRGCGTIARRYGRNWRTRRFRSRRGSAATSSMPAAKFTCCLRMKQHGATRR
jgi:hypothetical protein